MKKLLLLITLALTVSVGASASIPCDSVLRRYAAQMLMVGFKGNTIDASSDAARYVRDLHVGGIILFDIDLTGTAEIGSRNIVSKEQVTKLTADLRHFAGYPLLIALDQEGGKICRLKTQYGFKPTVSALHLGTIDNKDTTTFYSTRLAREVAEVGVTVNLSPVLDIHNPQCPPIGHFERSFSADTAVITRNAGWVIDAHHRQGVLCAVKHFPGHGSALSDSHRGFVDVTSTWHSYELAPFRDLIKKHKIDIVMTAHIFNGNIDPDYPATLSKKTIDGVLRGKLGYNGVVLTDDMYMQGIIQQYSIEKAIILAINAGADMLCVGNNISTGFEPDRPFKLVDMIVTAVKAGQIPYSRLEQSHQRIEKLLKKIK
jgi:beta-N-acetylhexosaminidase